MKRHFLFVTVLTLCAINYSIAQTSSWELVYENNEVGKTIQGDKAKLIEAVENCSDVKVIWQMGFGENKVVHSAQLTFMTIMGGEVFGQTNAIMSQKPNQEEEKIGFRGELKWTMIASTTGENANMYFNNKNTEAGFYEAFNSWGCKWFVRK